MNWRDFALIGTTVGVMLVGVGLTILIEVVRGQMERKQRREDRRVDYRRERTAELLEPARSAYKFLIEYYEQRYDDWALSGLWGRRLDDIIWANVSSAQGGAFVRLKMELETISRLVGDKEIANQVGLIVKNLQALFQAESEPSATTANNAAIEAYLALFARIGEMMRAA